MKKTNQIKQNAKDAATSKKKTSVRSYIFIPVVLFLIVSIFLFLLPEKFREEIGWLIITLVVSVGGPKFFAWLSEEKRNKIAPVILAIIAVTVPSVTAVSKPQFFNLDFVKISNEVSTVSEQKYDSDLFEQVSESVAIETAANDVDESAFNHFYKISYVKNGTLKSDPSVPENAKIQLIMDSIVNDIEQSATNSSEHSDDELNSGNYGTLTGKANAEEEEYKKNKGNLDKQQKVEHIKSYLQKRIRAYEHINTSELARLIGNTYAELSQHQTANDNIYSNCDAIAYYFKYCCLSKPEDKSKMYYEMGVRFNKIAEIAYNIFKKEDSDDYKNVYVDSLYMSTAYYKLYKQCYISDYKNNFYLARNYKMLAENITAFNDKSAYLEKALNILFSLTDEANNISATSKSSLFQTLYNTIIQYETIPTEYWKEHTHTYISKQKDRVRRLIS